MRTKHTQELFPEEKELLEEALTELWYARIKHAEGSDVEKSYNSLVQKLQPILKETL